MRTKRAFIVRFVSVNDLVHLIVSMKLPNEKTPMVKSNRDFRIFEKSEFHALQAMRKHNVNLERIESIFQLNS